MLSFPCTKDNIVELFQIAGDVETDENGQAFDDNLVTALVQELSHIGDVVLVRFMANTMWATFRDGASALAVAAKKVVQVRYTNIYILKNSR